MRTGEAKTLTAFSNPLKMPIINLPLGSSVAVLGSFFIPLFALYFIFGFTVSFVVSIFFGTYIWRYLKKRYLLDPDYTKIQAKNSRRPQPYKKDRFYAS
tara:strand:- start:254 stop:550 length:297 start_codon:yes stop_codon:yes gene_type:complete